MKWHEELPAICSQRYGGDSRAKLTRIARALPGVVALRVLRSNDPLSMIELFLPVFITFPDSERQWKLTGLTFTPYPFHCCAIARMTNDGWVTHDDQFIEPCTNPRATQIKARIVIALNSGNRTTTLN
jgi:hypothetical protein